MKSNEQKNEENKENGKINKARYEKSESTEKETIDSKNNSNTVKKVMSNIDINSDDVKSRMRNINKNIKSNESNKSKLPDKKIDTKKEDKRTISKQELFKNNDNIKTLEEDRKALEKDLKKYHIGLIINITIIIIIFILIVLFFKPGIIKKDNNINDDQQSVELNTATEEEFVNKIYFSEFKIVKDNSNSYIIGKENDSWKEILKVSDKTNILGTYKNNLYYYDEDGLAYIDFESETYKRTEWLKYKQYKVSETGEVGNLNISKASMIDDIIYFKYNLNTSGSSSTNGILSINVNDNSFDKAVQILSDVESNEWEIDVENKLIYYSANSQDTESLFKYNISTNEKELILSDIKGFQIEGQNILYLKLNNSYKTSANTIVHAATYDLYLYDMNTKENKLIYESSIANINSNTLYSFAECHNGDIYYKVDNKIVQYNNGANTVIYTYSPNSGEDYLYGFKFKENNIIELILQNDDKKYLINGKVYDDLSNESTITVTMSDGSTKNF